MQNFDGETKLRTELGFNPHEIIDTTGNSGIGLVAKFGTCSECGRENKIVGPKDVPPDERTCFGGCDKQKGPVLWEQKLLKMGWK